MKKFLHISITLLLILTFMFSTGCTRETILEKPDIFLDGESGVGYASRIQYFTIKYLDVEGAFYYDIGDRTFKGTLENTDTKQVENISVEFILDSGEVVGKTDIFNLEPNQIQKIEVTSSEKVSNTWKFILNIDDAKKSKDKRGPIVIIANRMQDGKLVALDTGLMNKYEKYDVKSNEGVTINNFRYAGRHQSYMLEYKDIIVNLSYNANHASLLGTIKNNSTKPLSRITLSISYDGKTAANSVPVGNILAGETKEIGFDSIAWKNFEVYKPVILFGGGSLGGDSESKRVVRIRDVF